MIVATLPRFPFRLSTPLPLPLSLPRLKAHLLTKYEAPWGHGRERERGRGGKKRRGYFTGEGTEEERGGGELSVLGERLTFLLLLLPGSKWRRGRGGEWHTPSSHLLFAPG